MCSRRCKRRMRRLEKPARLHQAYCLSDPRADQRASPTMTPDESRKLKTGTRCYNGDPADLGTVTATETRYVTIKWDDASGSRGTMCRPIGAGALLAQPIKR